MYGKNLLDNLTHIYVHMPCKSICQFQFFFTSWTAIYSDRQHCKDIIQIKICNNINKRTKIVFKFEFLISQY